MDVWVSGNVCLLFFSYRYNSIYIYIALQLWFYVYKSDDEGRR